MKTAEELANEKYYDIPYPEDIASVDDYTTNEIRLLQRIAYVAGYNEAMRWRDPEEELPEFNKEDYPNGDYKRYLIKVVKGSISTRIYVTVGWLISANRWNVEMDWVSVIGWRPI